MNKELFGDVIEECENQGGGGASGQTCQTENNSAQRRKKGEPRQRPPMTAEQTARCKAQQLKQLVYAERLNKGLPLDQGDHAVGEVAHFEGVWELGEVDGEHTHHMQLQEVEGEGDDEQLACLQQCDHQQAWLPPIWRESGESMCDKKRREELR